MKTKPLYAVILLLAFASACEKEPLEKSKENAEEPQETLPDLNVSEAKSWYESQPGLQIKYLANWEKAHREKSQQGDYWSVPLPGQPKYQGIDQGWRSLAISRNHHNLALEAHILEIIPDGLYLQEKRKVTTENFTGRLFIYDTSYRLLGGNIYDEGKLAGEISPDARLIKNQKMTLNPVQQPHTGGNGKTMLAMAYESCAWVQSTYVDSEGIFTVFSERICTNYYIDIGSGGSAGGGGYGAGVGPGDGGYHGGGGGGSNAPSNPPIPSPSNLPGEDQPTVDPKKLTKCFDQIQDPNAAFAVRVHVQEPMPGTSFNIGPNSFGHVAIELSKTSGSQTIAQVMGFYPTGNGLDKLNSPSRIVNNGDIANDVSATFFVNLEDFQSIINYVSNPPANYHYTDFNCTSFVYMALVAGNISIPSPVSQVGMGWNGQGLTMARTPAGMGNALRQMKTNNPNANINIAGGRASGSKGECN